MTHIFKIQYALEYHVDASKHQEAPFLPSSLLGKQGKPVRVFGFALACWGFPNPFSHFVWLRVSAKRCITSDGILQKNKKSRSQTPIESASDSGCPFVVFMVVARLHFQKKAPLEQSLKNYFDSFTHLSPMFYATSRFFLYRFLHR